MRKILTLFVAALFATSMMYAQDAHETSGDLEDGTGLSWSFADGTLTITYNGSGSGVISFPDDVWDTAQPWYDWSDEIESISLPDGLKVIGDNAFAWSAISSITIPNSVTEIGYDAFGTCENLETITLSDNLETIGEYAFCDCAFTSFTIPGTVTFIGEGAFNGCTSVTDVYCYPHPENLTWETKNSYPDFKEDGSTICHIRKEDYIYARDFAHVNVKFRDDLDNLYGCGGGLTWAYADGTLTITYDNTYEGEHDGAIISVTPMPWNAYLSEITSISLPEGLKRIGVRVFEGCSAVEEVTIPSSVSTIEYYAFKSCSSLKSVIALPTTAPSVFYNSFEGCHADLTITYPCGSTESYESEWSKCNVNLESTCETPTGMEEMIESSNPQIFKSIKDGQLLITRDGKLYNVTGAEVK